MDVGDEPDVPDPHEDEVIHLQVVLAADRGFVRRECPTCEREFKRLSERVDATTKDTSFVCPYCYESAEATTWWTKPQLAYVHAVTRERVLAPQLREFQRSLQRMNNGGGLFGLTFEMTGVEQPPALQPVEPEDMTRVEFVCHPEEPLRIADDWAFDVACTICGTRYPFADVRRADLAA